MNNTTVSTTKKARDIASKRAKKDNLPLSVVTSMLLEAYGNGDLDIGVAYKYDKKIELMKLIKEIKNPEDLSPVFESMEEAITWLKD
jgi:hypothetical protein